MAGNSLNQSASLMCPHGGTVSIVTTNSRVKGGGGYLVTQNDTFTIAGCPFVVGTVASPCVKVQWVAADTAVTVGGAASLSQGSTGLCVNGAQAPQGPVSVVATQAQVRSR